RDAKWPAGSRPAQVRRRCTANASALRRWKPLHSRRATACNSWRTWRRDCRGRNATLAAGETFARNRVRRSDSILYRPSADEAARERRSHNKKPRRGGDLIRTAGSRVRIPGAEGGTRTHTLLRAADFESAASTDSAT